MKKSNKKGFTIVELVIVIAVIAILSAVLIPTFSNITKKAKESAAMQEATNAMTAVLVEEDGIIEEGKTYYVVYEKDNYFAAWTIDGNKLAEIANADNIDDITALEDAEEIEVADCPANVTIYLVEVTA